MRIAPQFVRPFNRYNKPQSLGTWPDCGASDIFRDIPYYLKPYYRPILVRFYFVVRREGEAGAWVILKSLIERDDSPSHD